MQFSGEGTWSPVDEEQGEAWAPAGSKTQPLKQISKRFFSTISALPGLCWLCTRWGCLSLLGTRNKAAIISSSQIAIQKVPVSTQMCGVKLSGQAPRGEMEQSSEKMRLAKRKTQPALRNPTNGRNICPWQTDKTFCRHFKAETDFQTGYSAGLVVPPVPSRRHQLCLQHGAGLVPRAHVYTCTHSFSKILMVPPKKSRIHPSTCDILQKMCTICVFNCTSKNHLLDVLSKNGREKNKAAHDFQVMECWGMVLNKICWYILAKTAIMINLL